MNHSISISRIQKSRLDEIDFNNLPFGKTFSDHMFTADYIDGQWQDFRITPFENLSVSPANMTFHYGQAVFEGMKADVNDKGQPLLFRPEQHVIRINRSAKRMGMPEFPHDLFLDAINQLVDMDKGWIPPQIGSSLYLRPFMIATDNFLGVKASKTYKFMIITGPVGPYYPKPVSILAEDHYVRAFPGGTGFAKAAGNYASTILPAQEANSKGFDQILWLDGKEYKYLQECGTMNIFAVIGDTIITPPTTDTILSGITRDSLLVVMKDLGYNVEVRPITIDEVVQASENNTLVEMFGTGTAAVISQVASLGYKGKIYNLPDVAKAQIGPKLKSTFEAIKAGLAEDKHNWVHPVISSVMAK